MSFRGLSPLLEERDAWNSNSSHLWSDGLRKPKSTWYPCLRLMSKLWAPRCFSTKAMCCCSYGGAPTRRNNSVSDIQSHKNAY